MESSRNILINLNYFGSFQIKYKNKILSENNWKSKKALAIFKFIAAKENKKAKKDILLDKFWSTGSIQMLHSTIYFLRKTIKDFINNDQICIVEYNNEKYSLNNKLFNFDYEDFKNLYNKARKQEKENKVHEARHNYKKALSLYKGDFLTDDLYTEWTREYRQYYKEVYIDIILRLSSLIVLNHENFERAVELCHNGLKVDPYREELHQSILSYLIKAGNYGKAAQKYREYSKMLADEFGIYPGPRTRELFKKINKEENRKMLVNDNYAFNCDKKTFELIFNLNRRKQERTGETFLLILLINKNEESVINDKLIGVLNKTLRKGDIICVWKGTIMLQLFQTTKEAFISIKKRMIDNLNEKIVNRLEIKGYTIAPESRISLEDYVI